MERTGKRAACAAIVLAMTFTCSPALPAAPVTLPATAAIPGDPKPPIQKLADKNATEQEKLAAVRQLAAMGPAARLATPTLCKLLKQVDQLAAGTSLAREAAIALSRIGPDAVAAAMGSVRAELSTIPPGQEAPPGWRDVLLAFGPVVAPSLADAVNDKCEALARLAPPVLIEQINGTPNDKNVLAAMIKLPPKIIAAWQRASANMNTPIEHTQSNSPYVPGSKHDPSHDQWMSDLIDLAAACGPKALEQLVQSADAKHAHAEAANLNTTIEDYAKAFHEPGPANDLRQQAWTKVREAGNAAFVPLCNLIATDAAARQQAMDDLKQILGGPRGKLTSLSEIRRRLINDLPPSVIPLDARRKAALVKAVPALSSAADQSTPEMRGDFETPIWILIMTAPDVPQAADALLAHLDHVPASSAGAAADALSHCDKSIQAKVAKSSPATDSGKKIVQWTHLRTLPLAQASAELKKISIEQRSEFVYAMDQCCGDDVVPLLLDSLGQVKINGFPPLHDRMPGIAPQVAATLDTADPDARFQALQLLAVPPLPPHVLARIGPMIEDEASVKQVAFILTDPKNRDAALPLLIELTQSPKPGIRSHAIGAAAALGLNELNSIPGDKKTIDQLAQAIAPHILDEDDTVRLAALRGAEQMSKGIQSALAEPIKASTLDQRKQIAQQIASAKSDDSFAPGAFCDYVLKPLQSSDDSVVADHAHDLVIRIQGLLAERSLAQSPADTAPPKASIDSSDATQREAAVKNAQVLLLRPDGIPEFFKIVALETTDPDPQVRAAAREATRSFGCSDVLLARLQLMAHSENETDRAMAAELLGRSLPDVPFPGPPPTYTPLASSPAPPQLIELLHTLNNDSSPKVKNAALIALSRCVSAKTADAKGTKAVLDALANASALDPAAKTAIVDCIPLMSSGDLQSLTNNPAAEVKTAALLGLEQPPGEKMNLTARVPLALAGKAALSQSQRVRRMAVVSLFTADLTDPTRQPQGAKALLPATMSTDESIAYDADVALVAMYCANRLTMPDKNGKIAPGGRLIRISDGKDVSQARDATPMEKDYGQVIRDSLDQPKPLRLAAIKTMGAKPSDFLGSGWFAFSTNLRDTDPQIRAAAFAATAANLATACTENNGVPKQEPQWARIYSHSRANNDQRIRESLRR